MRVVLLQLTRSCVQYLNLEMYCQMRNSISTPLASKLVCEGGFPLILFLFEIEELCEGMRFSAADF